MNVIDWLSKSAEFMSVDRNDLYPTASVALVELCRYVDYLRDADLPYNWVSFSAYVLFRTLDDGVEDFMLTRKLSSVTLFEDAEESLVFSHTTLSTAVQPGVDLPGPLDDPVDTDDSL